MRSREWGAVVLLPFGAMLLPPGIGWVIGAVLLWTSPAWDVRDRLVGTLIWPGGIAGGILLLAQVYLRGHDSSFVPATHGPGYMRPFEIAAIFAVAAAPLVVSGYLIARARR